MVLLSLSSLAPHRTPRLPTSCSPSRRPVPRTRGLPRRLLTPALPGLRRPIQRAVATAAIAGTQQVQEEENRTSEIYPKWREFASRVSGEWDGYGAEFTSRGAPIELPENVVPEAFREWGVQVFDWQTQCPTLAEPGKPYLMYRVIKLLPTVGCEADAATIYSVEEKIVKSGDNKVFAFAYDQSGSYVAIWAVKEYKNDKLLEVEHCLVDPRNQEVRVRIVQTIQLEKTKLRIQKIKVFSEQWYGPFRNGEQLGGCAIRESGFASTGAMRESEVLGTWQRACVSASFENTQTGAFSELVNRKAQKLIRDQEGLIMLPKQLWCSAGKGEDGEIWAEVGWLIDHGSTVTSRCSFMEDGNLKEIAIGHEAAMSKDV